MRSQDKKRKTRLLVEELETRRYLSVSNTVLPEFVDNQVSVLPQEYQEFAIRSRRWESESLQSVGIVSDLTSVDGINQETDTTSVAEIGQRSARRATQASTDRVHERNGAEADRTSARTQAGFQFNRETRSFDGVTRRTGVNHPRTQQELSVFEVYLIQFASTDNEVSYGQTLGKLPALADATNKELGVKPIDLKFEIDSKVPWDGFASAKGKGWNGESASDGDVLSYLEGGFVDLGTVENENADVHPQGETAAELTELSDESYTFLKNLADFSDPSGFAADAVSVEAIVNATATAIHSSEGGIVMLITSTNNVPRMSKNDLAWRTQSVAMDAEVGMIRSFEVALAPSDSLTSSGQSSGQLDGVSDPSPGISRYGGVPKHDVEVQAEGDAISFGLNHSLSILIPAAVVSGVVVAERNRPKNEKTSGPTTDDRLRSRNWFNRWKTRLGSWIRQGD